MPQEPSSKRLISATQMSPVTESQLVAELKKRMKARGDTGQIKRAEQLLGEIHILKAQAQNTDAKLNAILKHLNIEAPPATASAVAQQPV